MKKILKSELTPQLVKHQEATLQRFNIQRDILSLISFSGLCFGIIQTLLLLYSAHAIISSDHEN